MRLHRDVTVGVMDTGLLCWNYNVLKMEHLKRIFALCVLSKCAVSRRLYKHVYLFQWFINTIGIVYLHLGHLANTFIQSNKQYVHLAE